jgi:hypothetical protein
MLRKHQRSTVAECNQDSYLAILHLSRVELHCKLQEKLHRVTWPYRATLIIIKENISINTYIVVGLILPQLILL